MCVPFSAQLKEYGNVKNTKSCSNYTGRQRPLGKEQGDAQKLRPYHGGKKRGRGMPGSL